MAAVAVAVAVHAAGLAWVALTLDRDRTPAPVAALDTSDSAVPSVANGLATVELWNEGRPGDPVPAVDGAGDQLATDGTHPLPNADIDAPGTRAAARGGGVSAGTESFTGRDDDDSARAQMWNHPDRYRLARTRTAAGSSTPESIVRDPHDGVSDRAPRRARARVGTESSSDGRDDGAGTAASPSGLPNRHWQDPENTPELDDPRAMAHLARGSTRTQRGERMAETGATATESDTRGPAKDRFETAAASDERDPAPIELSSSSAGGTGERGVRGKSAKSGASRRGRGSGTAATRADVAGGSGGISVRAGNQNAYFRQMYAEIDKVMKYPKDLALSLEQGTVVVRFTLSKSGAVGDVKVTKSSGFKEFDRAFTRALRRAAPFGRVPASLRGSSDRITVRAPYTFSNPLIR